MKIFLSILRGNREIPYYAGHMKCVKEYSRYRDELNLRKYRKWIYVQIHTHICNIDL